MLKFWDKQSPLTLVNGVRHTAEEIMNDENFGFSRNAPTLIEEKGGITYAIENLYILKSVYKIDESLSDAEALAAIEELRNAPEAEPLPSAEERIAAALEYQNLSSLTDIEGGSAI